MPLPLLLSLAIGIGPSLQSPQSSPANPTLGVVYFYFTTYTGPQGIATVPNISVYCDGRIVAKLKKASFVGVRVPPGRHTFASKGLRTSLEETAIQLEVRPGAITFVRLEVGMSSFKVWAHLRVVGRDEGQLMVSKLDPVGANLIEDLSRATTTRPAPASLASPSADPPLTNSDVVALMRVGLDGETILLKIQQSRAAYDLAPENLILLGQDGVSEQVIAAMKEASRRVQDVMVR